MECLCRPQQIAVVMILQSSASGDLPIRPLSSTMEDLGMKTVLLAARMCVDRTTFHNICVSFEQNGRTRSTSASVNTTWDTIRARGRFFLCCSKNHQILPRQLSILYLPDFSAQRRERSHWHGVIRRRCVTRTFDTKKFVASYLTSFSSIGRASFCVGNCMKTENRFLRDPCL